MKRIATLLTLAMMLVAVGCSKEETPPPANSTPAATTPPPVDGQTQRQGGLPAPKLNDGAGVNNFGTR